MTSAFKCDGCGEFEEGHPNRFKLREYGGVGMTGWADASTVARTELCDDCAADIVDAVAPLVKGSAGR